LIGSILGQFNFGFQVEIGSTVSLVGSGLVSGQFGSLKFLVVLSRFNFGFLVEIGSTLSHVGWGLVRVVRLGLIGMTHFC